MPPDTPFATTGETGKDYWWCSCGKSQTQPLCDGSHRAEGAFTPVMYTATATKTEHRPQSFILKILVDCSGSVCGDSIHGAMKAQHEVIVMTEMTEQNWVSYSRFGNDMTHEFQGLQACTPATLLRVAQLIAQTDANLGGPR